MKYFADSERKMILVSDEMYPLGTYYHKNEIQMSDLYIFGILTTFRSADMKRFRAHPTDWLPT